jgi:hypothetical protein
MQWSRDTTTVLDIMSKNAWIKTLDLTIQRRNHRVEKDLYEAAKDIGLMLLPAVFERDFVPKVDNSIVVSVNQQGYLVVVRVDKKGIAMKL